MKIVVRALLLIGLVTMVFGGAVACKGHHGHDLARCKKGAAKMIALTKQATLKSAKADGDSKAELADLKKKLDQKLDKMRASVTKKCMKQMKADPSKTNKQLDCMLASKTEDAMEKCLK